MRFLSACDNANRLLMVPWIVNFVLNSINLSHFYILSNTDVASIRRKWHFKILKILRMEHFKRTRTCAKWFETVEIRYLLVFINKMIYPSCIFCNISINSGWSLVTTANSPAGYACQSPNSWRYTYQWSTGITLYDLFTNPFSYIIRATWYDTIL